MANLTGNFYTTDFDQEMLDFIKNTYPEMIAAKSSTQDVKLGFYLSSSGHRYFWTNDIIEKSAEHLTKQQFKERIGMTKSSQMPELIAGRHFAVTEDGRTWLVLDGKRLLEYGHISGCRINTIGWNNLKSEIDNIVQIYDSFVNSDRTTFHTDYATLVWERPLQTVELTLSEIADKFGISVSELRIKD